VQSSIEKATHRIFSSVVVREEEERDIRARLEVTFAERKGAAGSRAKKEKKKDLDLIPRTTGRRISRTRPVKFTNTHTERERKGSVARLVRSRVRG
jgi:hypothetical protein